jgi:hypothetical protein
MNTHKKTILMVSIFAIAMAALEGAVVVYLRALYYPGEFTVAFRVIDENILITELVRELATIVMLIMVGYLAGKNFRERFAYFLLGFAVWDIFYYVWLKIFIQWPASILDWDILFLIPVTWLGPVLAPLICSVTMIALAIVLLQPAASKSTSYQFWMLLISGCAIILATFMYDYFTLLVEHNLLWDYANLLHNEKFVAITSAYIPESYPWWIFALGESLIIAAMATLKHGTGKTLIPIRSA